MIRDSVGHYGLRTRSDGDERFARGVPVRRERFARGGRGDAGDGGVQPLRARVGAADAEVQVGVCSCGAGGGLCHPTILSQGNRYIASPDLAAKEVTQQVDVEVGGGFDDEWGLLRRGRLGFHQQVYQAGEDQALL
ncbi:putative pectate lyase P59 [Platanthera guangdongensis]|uniref:Pectate lyase P59 n=1 Tax=Platanthera guangdongensis TaxID=2320717 RepID=A0ABR2LWH4_9ASPA